MYPTGMGGYGWRERIAGEPEAYAWDRFGRYMPCGLKDEGGGIEMRARANNLQKGSDIMLLHHAVMGHHRVLLVMVHRGDPVPQARAWVPLAAAMHMARPIEIVMSRSWAGNRSSPGILDAYEDNLLLGLKLTAASFDQAVALRQNHRITDGPHLEQP